MKRGPKSLLTKKLQDAICTLLANANTIKTACAACGIGERTFHDWVQDKPAFAAATRRARAYAKIQLVTIIRNAARTNANHAQWLLERSWPNEYARTERIEQIGEKADDKSVGVRIYYNAGNSTLAELLSFPVHSSMGNQTEADAEKQRRLLDQTMEAPETISDAPAPKEKISTAPPPKVVDKRLTGRIPDHWKGNGKK